MSDYTHFLEALKFTEVSDNRWERRFDYPATGEYIITVDTGTQTIDYPKPIECKDRTTSNFDHQENFVVLECVCRLLAKGYDPATLILEKRYQLGRGASGGKSDITVLRRTIDPEDQANAPPLLIIECKTWGREHDLERQKTLDDGGQLFGYLQQDRAARHLCIYSSRLNNELPNKIEYHCDIIHVEDTAEALEKFTKKERDESHTAACEAIPLFQHAHNRESLHRAWQTTYDGAFQSTGIFEDRFTPYAIGYQPITKDLLREFNGQNGSTKVFNRFMEILRHNNVSDKENAFNRLCAIILAKLIDEEKAPEAILDFQWFPEKDTAEDLIDRLQRLYKRGMKETLGEDITYFEERDIDYAFRAHRRDMAKKEVKRIFRALKFYTNSDFAFKEVHNQKLFEQNTQVVREIVELFQGYRLKYTSKQAFLGNLFELLLNSGFKQSEGQFFTPIPIARFIVRCLPIRERIEAAIKRGDQHVIPRVMDYACGSAHFLTEIVEEIQEDLAALGREESVNTTWTRDYVWGIEKDYRLARTAKIAMFLHGAGDANILHEDGLDHLNPTLPQPGTVDILIANPPYSISSFKEHLGLQANQFSLLPFLTNTSSEIETLFVERAAQLLKVGGLAGLILPSSILSNAGIYQRTRALLLNKFLIRGIVEMGGSAFIATGTNTVILFLERRPDTDADHFAIRADALFYEDKRPNDADFADSDLLSAYTTTAGVNLADYLTWLSNLMGELPEALAQSSLFSAYISEFEALPATRTRKNQQSFRRLTEAEQEAEMLGKLLAYIRDAEHEKFLYFALAYAERLEGGELIPQHTTIVRGAGNKAEEQAFLGYKWSQRRGSEGMVFLREPYDGGQLFTPETDDRTESLEKAAYHLRTAFNRADPAEHPDDCPLATKLLVAPTPACLDFTRTTSDLAINLSPKQGEEILLFETQYPLVPFNQIATLEYGKPLPERARIEGAYPVMGSNGAVGTHNEYLIEGPAIIVGRKGSAGRIVYEEQNCYPIDTTFYVVHDSEQTELRYIQHLLLELNLEGEAKTLGVPGLNRNDVYKKLVPLPPLPVQKQVVEAIEQVEAAEAQARDNIATAQQAVNSIVARCYESDLPKRTIESLSTMVQYGLSKAMNEDGIGYKIFRMNEIIAGRMVDNGNMKYVDITPEEFTTYRLNRGDVLFNRTNGSIDQVGKTGLFDLEGDYCCASYLVRITTNSEISPKILTVFMNSSYFLDEIRQQAVRSAGQNNINATKMKNMSVPVPSIPEQQALLEEIQHHEANLIAAEAELAAAPSQKRQILLDGLK